MEAVLGTDMNTKRKRREGKRSTKYWKNSCPNEKEKRRGES